MHQILPRLYLGAFADVPTTSPDITYVLTLCEKAPETSIALMHTPIPDEVWLSAHVWQHLVDALSTLMDHGHGVLVHCRLGVSRSPALVSAYLVDASWVGTLEEGLAHVMDKRACVKIHSETWKGLQQWASQR